MTKPLDAPDDFDRTDPGPPTAVQMLILGIVVVLLVGMTTYALGLRQGMVRPPTVESLARQITALERTADSLAAVAAHCRP